MKFVERKEFDEPEFLAWKENARLATEALHRAHTDKVPFDIKDKIYKGAMPFLLRLFSGKCAYCETSIETNQPGDVEHYRPKAGLRDMDGEPVRVGTPPDEQEHPGYWWLAYDWKNLLPACIDCNRRRRHGLEEDRAGKGEHFPVTQFRAAVPGEEEAEAPLLIDPCAKDPKGHFEFSDDGLMRPLTTEGATSCAILGLNLREGLVRERRRRVVEAQRLLMNWLQEGSRKNPGLELEELASEINDIWHGKTAYSAHARTALENQQQHLARIGINLTFPVPATF